MMLPVFQSVEALSRIRERARMETEARVSHPEIVEMWQGISDVATVLLDVIAPGSVTP